MLKAYHKRMYKPTRRVLVFFLGCAADADEEETGASDAGVAEERISKRVLGSRVAGRMEIGVIGRIGGRREVLKTADERPVVTGRAEMNAEDMM